METKECAKNMYKNTLLKSLSSDVESYGSTSSIENSTESSSCESLTTMGNDINKQKGRVLPKRMGISQRHLSSPNLSFSVPNSPKFTQKALIRTSSLDTEFNDRKLEPKEASTPPKLNRRSTFSSANESKSPVFRSMSSAGIHELQISQSRSKCFGEMSKKTLKEYDEFDPDLETVLKRRLSKRIEQLNKRPFAFVSKLGN